MCYITVVGQGLFTFEVDCGGEHCKFLAFIFPDMFMTKKSEVYLGWVLLSKIMKGEEGNGIRHTVDV